MPFETFPVEILQTTSEFFKNSDKNSDQKSSQLHILTGDDNGQVHVCMYLQFWNSKPERIYNPITAMGFSAMFTFQLDNTKR